MKRYNFTNPLFLLKIEAMIRRFYILFCLVFLVACDDGDILTVQLDFEQELERCDNFEDSYIIFDTKDDLSEGYKSRESYSIVRDFFKEVKS